MSSVSGGKEKMEWGVFLGVWVVSFLFLVIVWLPLTILFHPDARYMQVQTLQLCISAFWSLFYTAFLYKGDGEEVQDQDAEVEK